MGFTLAPIFFFFAVIVNMKHLLFFFYVIFKSISLETNWLKIDSNFNYRNNTNLTKKK